MPSIEWNRLRWDGEHAWPEHGDEWSYGFGSAAAHWYGFILPRLYPFLPDATITDSRVVEIAPGHGRWTQFLLPHCTTLVGYDLAEGCVAHCGQRFAAAVAAGRAVFRLTDGRTLAEADNSVNLVFSYDSLVHAERDVMQSYLGHIARCLKPGGFAFLQHSNLGTYPHLQNFRDQGPYNCRGSDVSVATMQTDIRACGLIPLLQEALNHETQGLNNEMTDCISLIRKPVLHNAINQTVVLSNRYYPAIGGLTRDFALPYARCALKQSDPS